MSVVSWGWGFDPPMKADDYWQSGPCSCCGEVAEVQYRGEPYCPDCYIAAVEGTLVTDPNVLPDDADRGVLKEEDRRRGKTQAAEELIKGRALKRGAVDRACEELGKAGSGREERIRAACAASDVYLTESIQVLRFLRGDMTIEDRVLRMNWWVRKKQPPTFGQVSAALVCANELVGLLLEERRKKGGKDATTLE